MRHTLDRREEILFYWSCVFFLLRNEQSRLSTRREAEKYAHKSQIQWRSWNLPVDFNRQRRHWGRKNRKKRKKEMRALCSYELHTSKWILQVNTGHLAFPVHFTLYPPISLSHSFFISHLHSALSYGPLSCTFFLSSPFFSLSPSLLFSSSTRSLSLTFFCLLRPLFAPFLSHCLLRELFEFFLSCTRRTVPSLVNWTDRTLFYWCFFFSFFYT